MTSSYIRTPEAAEENAARVMRELGYIDAKTTGRGADGGIDVVSRDALAQVKWQGALVGRPELQRLYGARGSNVARDLLFFTASGFSSSAQSYAAENGIALFVYDPLGTVTPENAIASGLTNAEPVWPADDAAKRARLIELFRNAGIDNADQYRLKQSDDVWGMISKTTTPDVYIFHNMVDDVGFWYCGDDDPRVSEAQTLQEMQEFAIWVTNKKPNQDVFNTFNWVTACAVRDLVLDMRESRGHMHDYMITNVDGEVWVNYQGERIGVNLNL